MPAADVAEEILLSEDDRSNKTSVKPELQIVYAFSIARNL